MDFDLLTSPEATNFINANLNADLHSLLLKKSPFPDIPMVELVQQIKGRKVALQKFPFLNHPGIVFPAGLSLEQSSSQFTAKYKANLVGGNSMADLTAGFGIDAAFLSRNFQQTVLVEQNGALLDAVKHNWSILGKKAEFVNKDLREFIWENHSFDFVFLDPARRDSNKNKVFLLEELAPNLLEIQDRLLAIAPQVMVKLSPLLDISYLVSVVSNLTEIHIVAVKNEVKELLIVMKRNAEQPIKITCINLETTEPVFSFNYGEEAESTPQFSDPQQYIYLPNNAVLKSGAYDLISQRFQLAKLHPNSHVYTSNVLLEHFPGRRLKMEQIAAGKLKKGGRFNILSKNHPLKPADIKKKYKLQDGGAEYLLFTQSITGKIILKTF